MDTPKDIKKSEGGKPRVALRGNEGKTQDLSTPHYDGRGTERLVTGGPSTAGCPKERGGTMSSA